MATMSESAFQGLAQAVLEAVERQLETSADVAGFDVEVSRHGNVLEIEFENGSKIVINSQAAMQEMWIAARAGGFHYRREGDRWINTRDGSEFFSALSRFATEQAGVGIVLSGH